MDEKLNVNMDGETFIEYLKYKDSKRFKMSSVTRRALPYFIMSGLAFILLIVQIEALVSTPVVWGYSNIFGVSVHNGLVVWFAAAIGAAWILHGFGFLIVRR